MRESPWIDEIRVSSILGPNFGAALEQAIEAELPGRGTLASILPWPEMYPMALLRAVVAEATVMDRRPSAVDVDGKVDEMLAHLAREGNVTRTIWLLTDLDVERVAGVTIHHVRLQPVRGLAESISMEMKEAAAEIRRLFVPLGSREPRALAIVDGIGRQRDWELQQESEPHLGHALTALRLVTAATIVRSVEMRGQPGWVHTHPPFAEVADRGPGTHWRRVGVVEPADIPGVEALARVVCDLEARPSKKVPSIILALHRFNRVHRVSSWQDLVVDLSIGLEAALSSADRREDLTLALKSRAAHLLASRDDRAADIFADLGDLMTIRGKVVHGVVVEESDWAKVFTRRGIDQSFAWDRLEVAIDRWRDLLRRAILARLMLGETGGPGPAPWPLRGGGVSVDGVLVDAAGRREWRRQARSRAADFDIARACRRSPSLRDLLHDPWSDDLDH